MKEAGEEISHCERKRMRELKEDSSPNSRRSEESLEFEESLFPAERSRSLIGLAVGGLIYPTFALLDLVTYPEQLTELFTIRLVSLVVLIAMALVVRRAREYRSVVYATAVGYVLPACGIALMCHLTEGVNSAYYAGIPLSTVFLAAFLTWPAALAFFACSVVLCAYFVPMIFASWQHTDYQSLALNSSFLIGTMVLVVLGMRLRLLLARDLYLHRQKLAQRNRELAELHDLKDRMFQNVSHELRTPLTLMLTPLQQRLNDESGEGSETSWTRQMYHNGMRLLKRINDLLDLARLDAKGVAVSLRAVDVGLLVHDLVSDLRAVVDVSGLKIETEIPESPLLYSLDAAHFERVLLNLIGNAVKFTPTGGEIRVRLAEAEDWLRVSVSDSGPGIPLAEQNTIFDRFRQLERDGNRRSEGSGIGLALVDELVQLLGGLIEVESEEGRGSTFTVKIPRSLKVRVSDDAAGEEGLIGNASMHRQAELESIGMKTPVSRRIRAGARGPEVLIVEDDDRLRRQLVGLLAESNRVTGVSGGEEGLREALLFRPHVVVSDVMMPGMDGVELCRRLRERAELRETAVVLLTAKGRLEDRIEGRRVGADSYLIKPFDVRELLATIEGLLRSRMRLVGDYIVQKRLGRGGQSEVWMAEHRLSGEPVALKIIRPSGLEDEKARERLRREHAALTQLEHPNIVKIVDRGEQAGGMFLAMEYLDGVTIDALIRGQTVFSVEVIASIGARAAAALAHVHDHELIHRDVKCSNLMLLAEGPNLGQRVRLIDFGTTAPARRVEGSGAGRIVGSLPYIAPELLERVADPSPGTDIYGLGVVLFRLATGLFPFRGRTVGRVLRASRRDPDPDLRIAVPSMPEEMISAIRRCLAFEPEKRWQKARSLERALLPFADDSRSLSLDAEETPTGATVTISDSMSVWNATTGR